MALNIIIDENYRITNDPYNFILEKSYQSKKKEKKWRAIGYYNRIDYLLRGFVAHKIFDGQDKTLLELQDTLRKLYDVCGAVGRHSELLKVPKG